MRLAEAIHAFENLLRSRGRRPSTIVSYSIALRQLARFLAERGTFDVASVSPEDLRDFGAALARHRYRRTAAQNVPARPLAASTRYNRLDHLRGFFAWLGREGVIETDPAAALPLGSPGKALPANVLTEEEAARLLAAPPASTPLGLRDRALLELFYSTGLRIGEVSALDLADVDLSAELVFVRSGKGDRQRVVPLGRTAAAAIARYVSQARSPLVRSPGITALFIGARGRGNGMRLKPCGIEDRVHQAANAAGIERRVTAHTLRHSFATHLLRAGAGIRHVQEILGHSRIDTTEIYTHVVISDLAAVHGRCHPRGRRR